MANEVLRELFQDVHIKIAIWNSVNPDPIIDALYAKKVMSSDDSKKLRRVPVTSDRCRHLMSLLETSSHHQTFIHLRLALLHNHSWIVDEIDKLLASPTSRLRQLRLDHSTDGKLLLIAYSSA